VRYRCIFSDAMRNDVVSMAKSVIVGMQQALERYNTLDLVSETVLPALDDYLQSDSLAELESTAGVLRRLLENAAENINLSPP